MQYITPAEHAALEREVHPSHRQSHVKPVPAPLHVVVGLSNPMRYASRYRLYHAFRKYVADSGAILTTVELQQGQRHFEVTSHEHERDVQLRSRSMLWHKENLLNIGVRHLPQDWQYMAWIDSDVVFSRPDWATEAVHLLQTYDVIQMWTHALDLGPAGQPIARYTSFVSDWQQDEAILQPWSRKDGRQRPRHKPHDGTHPIPPDDGGGSIPRAALHTGYAWAMTREAYESLGGLVDVAVLGSADRHMAYALIGEVDQSYPTGVHPNYAGGLAEWQRRAERGIGRNIGAMEATVLHHWHGSKQHRRYQDRWQILTRCQYDPRTDVLHNANGVLEWTHENRRLERQVRQYFAVRSEDSIDL